MDGKQLDITEILSEHGSGSDGNEYLQLIDLTKLSPSQLQLYRNNLLKTNPISFFGILAASNKGTNTGSFVLSYSSKGFC